MTPDEEKETAALTKVFSEHDVLAREADETGQPVHDCGPIMGTCPFIWDRGHALGVCFAGCDCGGCRASPFYRPRVKP